MANSLARETNSLAREISSLFFLVAQTTMLGNQVSKETLKQIYTVTNQFFAAYHIEKNPDVMVEIDNALKRLIPTTCLPNNFETFEDLTASLIMELSGSVVLLPKDEYDVLTGNVG